MEDFSPSGIEDPQMRIVRSINDSNGMGYLDDSIINSYRKREGTFYLYLQDKDGYAIFRRGAELPRFTIHLLFLGVRAAKQGGGIASSLLDFLFAQECTTRVWCHSRKSNIGFYEHYAEKRGHVFICSQVPVGEYPEPRPEPKYFITIEKNGTCSGNVVQPCVVM